MNVVPLFFVILFPLNGILTVIFLFHLSDERPDMGWIEFCFASLAMGVLLVGWVALLLAELGYFDLGFLLLVQGVYGVGLLLWLVTQSNMARYIPQRTWVQPSEIFITVIAIVLGGYIFARPTEYVFGGADAGVYVNISAQIARTGWLLAENKAIAEIPAQLRPGLLRQQLPELGYIPEYLHLPGFYVDNVEEGLIIPQFLALHPTWLAIGNSIAGLSGSLYLTPIWAIFGVLALYWAGRVSFDGKTAALAALLLLVNPAQIFLARYPTSEALTQFLLWLGFYGLVCLILRRSGYIFWGVMAGLVLGQVGMARIDTVPMTGLVVLWLVGEWSLKQWRAAHTWFLVSFLLATGHAILHTVIFAWPYTFNTYQVVILFLGNRLLFVPVAVFIGLGFVLFLPRVQSLTSKWNFPWFRHLISVTLIGLTFYAYFIRPYTDEIIRITFWYSEAVVPISDHLNLIKLGWYLSPLGILLALLGAVLIIHRASWWFVWPVGAIGLTYTTLYIARITANPHHIYAARRYVPLVIPMLLLTAAYGIAQIYNRRGWSSKVISSVLFLVMLGWMGYHDRILLYHTDYQGVLAQVEEIAASVPRQSLLLFNDLNPVGAGAAIGTPLHYMYDFTAFDLQEKDLNMEALNDQLAVWWSQERPTFLFVGQRAEFLEDLNGSLEPVADFWVETQILESSYEHFPQRVYLQQTPLELYQIRPEDGTGPGAEFSYADLGVLDYPFRLNGFYDKEKVTDGTDYRWTGPEASLVFPKATLNERIDWIKLRVAGGRPDGVEPATVGLWLNGQELGHNEITNGFQIVTVPLSSLEVSLPAQDGWELTLRSTTWSPKDIGRNDDRELGIMVDWIEIGK